MNLAQLPDNPFVRLRALLNTHTPGADPINLSLGEPGHAPPAFVAETIAQTADGFGRYPPIDGTPAFRAAAGNWLGRRYNLAETALNYDTQILPVNGTREALFLAAQLAPKAKTTQRPAVLIPNPFYQCYAAAALSIGAEPVYLPTSRETNFLPDLEALPDELLERTVAVYLCSPANPQGTCASIGYWQKLFKQAQTFDFLVLADECYAEIYDRARPPGALEAANGVTDRLLSFHSLSKRSNLPGLRSGFVAGGERLISDFRKLRLYGGAPLPLPVLAASAATWNDDTHVEENRAAYRAKFEIAANLFGNRLGFYRPPGGFFLWLDVNELGASDEEATLKLWQGAGVRVLPGSYLSRSVEGKNPGAGFVRIALVSDIETTEKALTRINQFLV